MFIFIIIIIVILLIIIIIIINIVVIINIIINIIVVTTRSPVRKVVSRKLSQTCLRTPRLSYLLYKYIEKMTLQCRFSLPQDEAFIPDTVSDRLTTLT